jgi:hypothetical protein
LSGSKYFCKQQTTKQREKKMNIINIIKLQIQKRKQAKKLQDRKNKLGQFMIESGFLEGKWK